MRFPRQSVPRHPYRVAMLALLRQTSIPKPHARITASSPTAGNAMLAAPMRSSLPQMRYPHSDGPRVHFEAKRAVRGSMRARTARLAVEMGQDTPKSIFPPSPPSLPAFSLCQRRCRPPRRYGPCGVTAAPSAGYLGGIGTGNIKVPPVGRVRSPPKGSNREQALHSRLLKFYRSS